MRRFRPVMSCICAVTVCLRCKLDTFMCSLVPVTVTLNLGEWQVCVCVRDRAHALVRVCVCGRGE